MSQKIPLPGRKPEFNRMHDFLKRHWLKTNDKILVVCGGKFDEILLESIDFSNYQITSLYNRKDQQIKNFSKEDAQRLSFPDNSFDTVMVNAGLHHCHSPHAALAEMYRVARHNIVVFESQDSFLMKILVHLGLVEDYERHTDQDMPNYVYRWTRHEVRKAIRSLDPSQSPFIRFYSEWRFPESLIQSTLRKTFIYKIFGATITKFIGNSAEKILNLLFKKQGNFFCFIIRKDKGRKFGWAK